MYAGKISVNKILPSMQAVNLPSMVRQTSWKRNAIQKHDQKHGWGLRERERERLTKFYLWSDIPNGMKKPNCSTGISHSLFHEVNSLDGVLQPEKHEKFPNLKEEI